MTRLWSEKQPVFGPGRRALVPHTSERKTFTSKDRALRDLNVLKTFWAHRPRGQVVSDLSESMGAPEFAAFLDTVRARFYYFQGVRDFQGGHA